MQEEGLTESECSARTPRSNAFDEVVAAEIGCDIPIKVGYSDANDSFGPGDTPALSK
jgi:hypothetical protein